MAKKYYKQDGAYHELPTGASLPEGAVEVDRLPGEFEEFVSGAWATNTAAKSLEVARQKRAAISGDPEKLLLKFEALEARVVELEHLLSTNLGK